MEVRGPAPKGDAWTGNLVAAWMSQQLSRTVSAQAGWVYLVRLRGPEGKRRKPRTRYVLADPEQQQQAAFKKAPYTRPGGRDCLPPGKRRALGGRLLSRAAHRVETNPAQRLVSPGNARQRRANTVMTGVTSSVLCIPPPVVPAYIWPPRSVSPSLKSSWGCSRARAAPDPPSRLSSSWIAPGGTPLYGSACPNTCICCSSHRIRPNSSPPSFCGR